MPPFANLSEAFLHQVATHPDATALIVWHQDEPLSVTWTRLADMVSAVVEVLPKLCLVLESSPARVGFYGDNSLLDVVIAIASPLANVIEVPVDQRLGQAGRDWFNAQVGGLWIGSEGRSKLTDAAMSAQNRSLVNHQRDPCTPALVLLTSGTTSSPQGVTLSHRNLVGNAQAKLAAVPQRRDDVRLTSLPLSHAYARTCDLGTWLLSGCTLAVGLGFQAWRTLGPVVEPTLANTVPSIARRLLSADVTETGSSNLRLLGCGGAAMAAGDFADWKDRGVTVIQGYGLTETSPVICSATPDNASPGLVGDFVAGWEHDIRDGRLFVRGPHVMLGYLNNDQATRARIDSDGWLDTGDMVQRDNQTGQVKILGRADDVIVLSNGYKVYPQAIECDLKSIDWVRHALIIGNEAEIEAWLDCNADDFHEAEAQVARTLSHRPGWEQPACVKRFAKPLSEANGELTSKGEIRRTRLIGKVGSRVV